MLKAGSAIAFIPFPVDPPHPVMKKIQSFQIVEFPTGATHGAFNPPAAKKVRV